MQYASILTAALLSAAANAQEIRPPYIYPNGEPVEALTVSAGEPVTAYVGINLEEEVTFSIEPPISGMSIEPVEGTTSAVIQWRPSDIGSTSVTVKASIDDQVVDDYTWTYEVGPFDIRELVDGSTPNVNIQEHYNRINLMVFMMGQSTFREIYGSRVADLVPLFSQRIAEAASAFLIQPEHAGEIAVALEKISDLLNDSNEIHPLRDATVVDHFVNDYRSEVDPLIKALYDEFDQLGRAGLDIPFIHGLKRDTFDLGDYRPDMATFIQEFLRPDQWGELTEMSRYVSTRDDYPGRDFSLLDEAVQRGVILQSRAHVVITPVRGGRCETKDNSKVCAQYFNGSAYVDTCIDCSNPVRQSFCALAEGSCSLASDPGPCSSYPAN